MVGVVEGLEDHHAAALGGVGHGLRASAALLAKGFSLSTCLPARMAARFQGACRLFGSGAVDGLPTYGVVDDVVGAVEGSLDLGLLRVGLGPSAITGGHGDETRAGPTGRFEDGEFVATGGTEHADKQQFLHPTAGAGTRLATRSAIRAAESPCFSSRKSLPADPPQVSSRPMRSIQGMGWVAPVAVSALQGDEATQAAVHGVLLDGHYQGHVADGGHQPLGVEQLDRRHVDDGGGDPGARRADRRRPTPGWSARLSTRTRHQNRSATCAPPPG